VELSKTGLLDRKRPPTPLNNAHQWGILLLFY
jgi:hypothetical protein